MCKRYGSKSTATPERHNNVSADPEQMERVFINLFANAVEAMEEGGDLSVKG